MKPVEDLAPKPSFLFVVTEDWYFVSHRLPLAIAARDAGYRVVVAARFTESQARLEAEGLVTRPIRLRRRGASVLQELSAILELRRLYREYRPVIVHHVALKPVLFGAVAAIGLRDVRMVHAIAGLGSLFSSPRISLRALRPLVSAALRLLLGRGSSIVIVQNDSDRRLLLERKLVPEARLRLIRGAGVELNQFRMVPEPEGVPTVVFAGRLLWEKGVGEFVEAAHLVRKRGTPCRFAVVGEPDRDSPGAVPKQTLEEWARDGVVEFWGKRADMPEVLAGVHVVCLPSVYGEGVPKILLEASACGRAVIATDWPGCRDAVRDGETGLLIPRGDVHVLADAIERLLLDPSLRRKLGAAGRAFVEREFDVRGVIAATMEIYRELEG